jgi:hypothetical protein
MFKILIHFVACITLFFSAFAGAGETTSIRIVVTGDTMGQVFPCQK